MCKTEIAIAASATDSASRCRYAMAYLNSMPICQALLLWLLKQRLNHVIFNLLYLTDACHKVDLAVCKLRTLLILVLSNWLIINYPYTASWVLLADR